MTRYTGTTPDGLSGVFVVKRVEETAKFGRYGAASSSYHFTQPGGSYAFSLSPGTYDVQFRPTRPDAPRYAQVTVTATSSGTAAFTLTETPYGPVTNPEAPPLNVPEAVGRTVFPMTSSVSGAWPRFTAVYPNVSLPLPEGYEVRWYSLAPVGAESRPQDFEDVNAATRVIGGIHSLWGAEVK